MWVTPVHFLYSWQHPRHRHQHAHVDRISAIPGSTHARLQHAHVDRASAPPPLPAAPTPQNPACTRGPRLCTSANPSSTRATESSPASANYRLRSAPGQQPAHQGPWQGGPCLWYGRRGPASVGVSAKSICHRAHSATCSSCRSTPGPEPQLRGGKLKLFHFLSKPVHPGWWRGMD